MEKFNPRFDEEPEEEEKKVPADISDEEEEPEDPFGLNLDADDYSEGYAV